MLYYDAFIPSSRRAVLKVHDTRYDYKQPRFPGWVSDLGYVLLIALCYSTSFCCFAFSLWMLLK